MKLGLGWGGGGRGNNLFTPALEPARTCCVVRAGPVAQTILWVGLQPLHFLPQAKTDPPGHSPQWGQVERFQSQVRPKEADLAGPVLPTRLSSLPAGVNVLTCQTSLKKGQGLSE